MTEPSSLAAILGQLSETDQILVRLALRREFVTPAQVQQAALWQGKLIARGQSMSIGGILARGGMLSEKQVVLLQKVMRKALAKVSTSEAPTAVPKQAPKQAPNTTVHLTRDDIDRMTTQMTPSQFKTYLNETFVDCAQRSKVKEELSDPFGPFKNRSFLGKGGMAVVYKVYDPHEREDVAIKVMNHELANDRDYIRRFLREAANTALINHENVVRLTGIGAVDGRLYFTLELIKGQTLKERTNEGRISVKNSLAILRQIVEALLAAHERGIGHRDIKPSNIMLTSNERSFGFDIKGEFNIIVKMTDFGLARMVGPEADSLISQEGQFLGTAKYIAPELIEGCEPSLQSDIFSLGIMAFQMFSGSPPFKVKKKVDYIEANLSEQAPLVHQVAPEIAPGIGLLVDAMLAKEPLDRPTADSLLRDIQRLEQMGSADYPEPPDDLSSVFHPSRRAEAKKRRRGGGRSGRFSGRSTTALPFDPKDRRLWMLAGVFLLIIILAFILLSGGGSDAPLPLTAVDSPPKKGGRKNGGSRDPVPDKPTEVELTKISALEGFDEVVWSSAGPIGEDLNKRRRFKGWVVAADEAYRKKNWDQAIALWQKSLLLRELPSLRKRIAGALTRGYIEPARKALAAGKIDEALTLCEGAQQKGAMVATVETIIRNARRTKRSLAAWAKGLALAKKLRKAGKLDDASRKLSELTELAEELGKTEEQKLLREAISEEKSTQAGETEAARYLEKTMAYIKLQSWDLASRTLESARTHAPDSLEVERIESYVKAGKSTIPGFAFIPPGKLKLFGKERKVVGMYVSKQPITHGQFKAYVDDAKGRRRRPKSWPGGLYPEELADDPVTQLRVEDAKRFAEHYQGRLPDRIERSRIDSYLGLRTHEYNKRGASGLLDAGFRIVLPLPDLR